MTYFPDTASGTSIANLPSASTLAGTDLGVVSQSGADGKATLAQQAAFALAQVQPSVPISGGTTLSASAHQRRDVVATTALTLIVPSAATLGDGFKTCLYTLAGVTVTLSGTVYDLTGATVTTIGASRSYEVKVMNGAVYALPLASAAGSGSAATAYTTSLSGSSGASGTPVTATFHPNGFWPTGEQITLTNASLAGTWSNATNATLSGSVLTLLAGNGDVTAVFTPSAASVGTINSTTSPSLTNTSGGQTYTATSGGGGASGGGTLLLDTITSTVKGAYSTRKLRAAFSGSAIRARRSSDNSEQDIGFTAGGGLDTAALLTFAGSGNAFLKTQYDQSGNHNDLIQATNAFQPKIVSLGSLISFGDANNRPAPLFDQSGPSFLQASGVTIGPASAMFAVASATSNATYSRLLGFQGSGSADDGASGSFIPAYLHGTTLTGYCISGDLSGATFSFSSARHQVASIFTAAQHTMTIDGTAAATVSWSGSVSEPMLMTLGSKNDGAANCSWNGCIAEVIVVNGAVAPGDQATIRSSQSAYFGTN